ncbi:MAG: heavy metal translocating P-type ATPase [Acidimicrobiales bacterium]
MSQQAETQPDVNVGDDEACPLDTGAELSITGMTCASCAARIEKKLNKLPGVEAAVNYATETAYVRYDAARHDAGELVATIEGLGYGVADPTPAPGPGAAGSEPAPGGDVPLTPAEAAAAAHLAQLRQRLLISAALALPALALSMVPALQFDNWQWLVLTLVSPVVVWGAWPFHRAAALNLRHGIATMDTLISLGTIAAYGYSLWALYFGMAGMPGMTMPFTLTVSRGSAGDHIYLEVAGAVTTFILAGRYAEARAKRRAGAALRSLAGLAPAEATVLEADGTERRVAVAALAAGDRFVVRPGEKVATDGVVEQGSSALDTSLVTGESVPVEVGPGDEVIGATVNVHGHLVVRATRVGADTVLAQVARLVNEAQAGKAAIQRLADRVAAVFVPAVVALSLATLGFWLVRGEGTAFAFSAAVAVLIIACPCALGLATPTALMVGTGRGAQLGIVIRGLEVLESTRRVDTIALDKTGTITAGVMTVVDVVPAPGESAADVLALAGALEAASEHPIGRAITAAARDAAPATGGLAVPDGFTNRAGLGVEGTVEGRRVVVGRRPLLEERALSVPPELDRAREQAEAEGRTAVLVAWHGQARGLMAVADTLKPTSGTAVARLRALGLTPVLITGDNEAAARAVAAEVGISEVHAGVLPAGKVDVIRRLQSEGRVVAMVGDGVNDAAALAQADLGLAMGTGADVAIEASDLTLVSGDLAGAADAIRLARRTLAVIKGNLFWAFAYNVAALPLAATGYLNPVIAGGAMALSSLFVVSNSLRLRTFQPQSGNSPGSV